MTKDAPAPPLFAGRQKLLLRPERRRAELGAPPHLRSNPGLWGKGEFEWGIAKKQRFLSFGNGARRAGWLCERTVAVRARGSTVDHTLQGGRAQTADACTHQREILKARAAAWHSMA